jgi:hypothetical protein
MNHRIYELEPPLKGKARGQKEKGKGEKDARINAVHTKSRQVTLSINGKTI